MSTMEIEIVAVTVTQPEGKKFQNMEVIYKNLSFQGKVENKKINSYYGKDVFTVLEGAKPGTVFTITREKNGEYWEWKTATKAVCVLQDTSDYLVEAKTGSTNRTYVADETKQDMIIRQSSLSTAVNYGKERNYNEDDVLDLAQKFVDFVYNKAENISTKPKEIPKASDLPADFDDLEVPF